MTIPGPPRRDATSLCGGYTHLAARFLMGNTTSVASIGCGRARQKSFFFFFLEKGKTRILTCVCLDVRRSRGGQCDWLNGLRGVGAGKQEGRGWGSLVALRAPPGALVLFCLSECIIDSTKYSVCQHRQAK